MTDLENDVASLTEQLERSLPHGDVVNLVQTVVDVLATLDQAENTLSGDPALRRAVARIRMGKQFDANSVSRSTLATGAKFTGWSGDGAGTDNPLVITMDADKTVTATLEDDPSYSRNVLALTANPPGYGSVSGGGTDDNGEGVLTSYNDGRGLIETMQWM